MGHFMFTGIVQGSFPILSVERKPGLHTLRFDLPAALVEGLTIGASVSVDGVCLTVATIEGSCVNFDVMQQTLSLTTIGELDAEDVVNLERSAKQGAEVGGHIVSGHVDGCAEVIAIDQPENNCFISYRVAAEKMKYIFPKGFVGLNGCSLTVCYIPETLRVTTHGAKRIGDRVNFEIDRQTQAIVDTVENFLGDNPGLLNAS